MNRKKWTEIIEYLAAVALAVVFAWVLSEHFATPLWGGLSSIPLQ